MQINEFLYPHHAHQGDTAAQALAEKLETFAHQVSYTCNLEIGGKLSPEDTFERLGTLWHQLQQDKDAL